MQSITLRDTAPSDLEAVMACERKYPEFVGQWSREQHMEAISSPSARHLIAIEDGGFLGYTILRGLGHPNGSAELMRLAIDTPGGGRGPCMLREILRYCFAEPGTHRVFLDVREHNLRAQKAYAKAGFVREGLLRECIKFQGEYFSLYVMSILEREYRERYRQA